MALPLRQQLCAGSLCIWSCSYESRRSWTSLCQLLRTQSCEFSTGTAGDPTGIQSGILSPNLKLALLRGGEIRLLLQSTATDLLYQESSFILKNGGALGEYLVWSCNCKSNCCILLAEKNALSGHLAVGLFLVFSWSICVIFSLFVEHVLAEWRS